MTGVREYFLQALVLAGGTGWGVPVRGDAKPEIGILPALRLRASISQIWSVLRRLLFILLLQIRKDDLGPALSS